MQHRNLLPALAGALTSFGLAACSLPGDEGPAFARVDRVALADDGVPYFVRGELGRVATGSLIDRQGAAAALADTLPAIAATFRIAPEDLVMSDVQRDHLGMTHVRYAQRKHGLPVVGGDLVVHVAADGIVRSVTSNARDGLDVDPNPILDARAAAEIARRATENGNVDVTAGELTYIFSTADGSLHLAWEITATGRDVLLIDRVYVDALTGGVVDRHPQVHTAKNREVFDAMGNSAPFFGSPGPRVATEGMPPASDMVARAAYDNTGITYDCYQTLFARDSYDGRGAKLSSVVHVTFRTPNGQTTGNNAAWIANPFAGGGQMVYGDGDGNFMGPTSQGFDVTAHELTHAVTSSTAKLAYQNESGALNEAMSDIMAAVCEAWRDQRVSDNTWLIGEQIFTPATAGDALRYMDNPTADSSLYPAELGGSRDFYADRYAGTQDNGGVHLNSGIANLAFYLLTEGGTHPRGRTTFTVPAIGIEKAGAIFQRALTQGYLTMNSTFAQARTATEEAAGDLYSPAEVAAVSVAWAAVGIGQPPAADTTPPTVSITSPASGATVAPGFTVDVTAADDRGVLRVELSIDGAPAGTDTSAPYAFTTAADLAEGSHTLTATAFDGSNQATASVTVTVDVPGGDDPGNPGDPGDGDGDGDEAGGCGCRSGGEAGGTAALFLAALAVVLRPRRRRAAA